jgi:hypothetical protein
MKHTSFIQENSGSELESKVKKWIDENEDRILEIVDIEYSQNGNVYYVTITYLD